MRRIVRWVVLVHAAILCWICVDGLWHFTPPPRAIAVRHVRRPPAPKAAAAAPQRKAAPVAPKPAPVAKKTAPKPTVITKATKKPAPAQKREEIQLPALITARPEPIVQPVNAPLQEEVEYEDELALFLERALVLPEQGEVEAELSVTPRGELASCRILSSKSKKNEEFLKKKLPNLFYPCFHETSNITVTVIFRNADLLKY